jgi:hypothetical protein
MLDRSQLALAVGHANVIADKSFSSCADYFHTGELSRTWFKRIKTLTRVAVPLNFSKRAFVIVEGDVRADITVSAGGTLLVHGDVYGSIVTGEQSEVVVAGDVLEGASISGDGILSVFVGGAFVGCLRHKGWCKAWIEGDLRGQVWTGYPATNLYVKTDFAASVRPIGKPSLLYMEVGGFMSYASLETISAIGYTEFNASIARSDRPAGMYTSKAATLAMREHRCHSRWVIRGA